MMRGRPTGATVHARARLLAGDEARTAARALSVSDFQPNSS